MTRLIVHIGQHLHEAQSGTSRVAIERIRKMVRNVINVDKNNGLRRVQMIVARQLLLDDIIGNEERHMGDCELSNILEEMIPLIQNQRFRLIVASEKKQQASLLVDGDKGKKFDVNAKSTDDDILKRSDASKHTTAVGCEQLEIPGEMPRQKQARQWAKAPYEVDELSTHEKSHITDEVLAQIPAHIFIAKFEDAEGDSIKMTIMPREIWTLHKKPKVVDAIKAIVLEQYFRLPPWGTDYMRAHELMSSILCDKKALLTEKDGSKTQVMITTNIVNDALHFYPGIYDQLSKTKSIDKDKAFLKAKGNKYRYSDMIYSELELPLRLISQHFKVQKPPRYTEPLLHIAIVMALSVEEKCQIRCNFGKFILENLIEANLKNSSKNKLYMSAGPILTRIAYQALGMIKDLPVAGSQASLIQHARFLAKSVKTTTTATSSRSTRSSKKSSSNDERTDTDKNENSEEFDKESQKEAEAKWPSKHEPSDEEDTSTPLDRKSKKPRSTEQILLDEAMAKVEARRKALADARAAKATTKLTKPMTIEEARKAIMERRKLEA
ncbi:hypothetical protein L7F22_005816 [Adiantum nelumboides]|nr:hypothetical protein [Adiantum nelumboides]